MSESRRSPAGALIWRRGPRLALLLLLLTAGAALVIGNRTSDGETPAPVDRARPAAQPAGLVYLTLGDSLGQGVQADPARDRKGGYARGLHEALTQAHGEVTWWNGACGGATTNSMIYGAQACAPDVPVKYANTDAESSQLAWAAQQLRARGDRPTLVTLTIGGNDAVACIGDDAARMRRCLKDGLPVLLRNWETIAGTLRDAAGARTVLAVATTYDPALAAVRLDPKGRLARAARVFHRFIVEDYNPAIRELFPRHDWLVADMGDAVNEDGAATPGGAPVRAVCELTWACERADIHLNDEGYAVLADVFRAATETDVAGVVRGRSVRR